MVSQTQRQKDENRAHCLDRAGERVNSGNLVRCFVNLKNLFLFDGCSKFSKCERLYYFLSTVTEAIFVQKKHINFPKFFLVIHNTFLVLGSFASKLVGIFCRIHKALTPSVCQEYYSLASLYISRPQS